MAIDSALKRRGKVPPLMAMPLPDSSVDKSDRWQKALKPGGWLDQVDTAPKFCADAWVDTSFVQDVVL